MGHVLCTRTQLEDGKNLGAGINSQPQPQDLCGAAQPGSQFVQLQVREVQVAEAALVQGVCMPACTSEPGRDGSLTGAEDPRSRGRVKPFSQRREHHCYLVRGSFQAVQRRVASSTEGGAAGLTPKRLDAFGLAMLAIAHQRVELIVGVAEVAASRVGTGEARGVYALGY